MQRSDLQTYMRTVRRSIGKSSSGFDTTIVGAFSTQEAAQQTSIPTIPGGGQIRREAT